MTKLADRTDIPVLEGGWINFTEAAERLGYTRSYMYKKASKSPEEGGFKTVRRIGSQSSFVINESEVDEILANQAPKKVKPSSIPADAPVLEQELGMEDLLAQIK